MVSQRGGVGQSAQIVDHVDAVVRLVAGRERRSRSEHDRDPAPAYPRQYVLRPILQRRPVEAPERVEDGSDLARRRTL